MVAQTEDLKEGVSWLESPPVTQKERGSIPVRESIVSTDREAGNGMHNPRTVAAAEIVRGGEEAHGTSPKQWSHGRVGTWPWGLWTFS